MNLRNKSTSELRSRLRGGLNSEAPLNLGISLDPVAELCLQYRCSHYLLSCQNTPVHPGQIVKYARVPVPENCAEYKTVCWSRGRLNRLTWTGEGPQTSIEQSTYGNIWKSSKTTSGHITDTNLFLWDFHSRPFCAQIFGNLYKWQVRVIMLHNWSPFYSKYYISENQRSMIWKKHQRIRRNIYVSLLDSLKFKLHL